MADEWYYSRDKQQFGPVPRAELQALADAGDIQPDDLVWKDGMAEWVKAGRVKGLLAPGPAAGRGGYPTRSRGTDQPHPGILWPVVVLTTTLLLAVNLFLPWWSVRQADGASASVDLSRADRPEFGRGGADANATAKLNAMMRAAKAKGDRETIASVRMIQWVIAYRGLASVPDDVLTVVAGGSVKVWGYHTAPGVVGLVTSIMVAPFCITALCVRVLRRWAWIAYFVGAVLAAFVAIASVVFVVLCPTDDLPESLTQGFSVGPIYAALTGTAAVVCCLWGAIVGLVAFVKAAKATH